MHEPQSEDVLRQAIAYLDEDANANALALLGPYVWRNHDDSEGLFRFGVALAREGKLRDAVRVLGRVLESNPNDGRALRNIGLAHLDAGDALAAEPYLRQAVRFDPDDVRGWATHARGLEELGRGKDAQQLIEDAARRFPEDHRLLLILLDLQIRQGAIEAAVRTANRLESSCQEDSTVLGCLLRVACESLDRPRAERVAAKLWENHRLEAIQEGELLEAVARAFPPPDSRLLRGPEERIVCPACGAAVVRSEAFGTALFAAPLDNLATIGALRQGTRCTCGLPIDRERKIVVLWPEFAFGCIVDTFPTERTGIGDLEIKPPGHFGEPAIAAPQADAWFCTTMCGPGAPILATSIDDFARAAEGNLPRIGRTGRADRRAREIIAALNALVRRQQAADNPTAHDTSTGVSDWMLMERQALLASGIACEPWPLDHVCRCGVELQPFLFGPDPKRLYEPKVIDEAAVCGGRFLDPATGESYLGFNCDACGRLHTWVLGVLPVR